MKIRGVVIASMLAMTLGLTGCSTDPAPAQSALATAPGINSARIVIGHPGAPWNVEPIITLSVSDGSADTIVAAVRSAAKAIDGTDVAAHTTKLLIRIGDHSGPSDDPSAPIPEGVGRQLGIGEGATRFSSIRLTADDIHRLAGE